MATRRAVGVYLRKENRFLLTQRGKNARHESYTWEGTGGEVESGESFEEAAKREALEEIDVVIDDLTEILDVESIADSKGVEWHTKIFTATTQSIPRIKDDASCAGFGWFTLEEIAGLKLASYAHKDIEALRKLG
jgi:8-oxo-dGTP pyrophosphatase MutT (NUDIX family)